ncbi:MAG: IS4 family transposase [Betaproteobacteria bacterium]|nr:IS4 family transposase [Betaproteobacteria bacterium]
MHALNIVQQLLRSCCPRIHSTRLTAILAAVAAAVRSRRLTLTELGRALIGKAYVKHSIKRVDRLLGNRHLAAERFDLYQALARRVVGALAQPLIVVDWTDLTLDRRWQLLRAALPIGGRCLTLYEEVHPLTRFGNPRVHRAFLAKLKTLLPAGVTPILITDAGFRAPWFKAVNHLGWHWIGRIRNRTYLRPHGTGAWIGCKTLYAQAHARPQALGAYDIVRSNPVACGLYLVKRPQRYRVRKSVFGAPVRSNQSLKQARAQREPWLLAASLSLTHLDPAQIVNAYAKRMQIEEAFRDLKCMRYGLGFSLSLSRSRERLAVLLLIALLSFFVLWLIGQQALARGLQFHYQSNTRRTRPVLSLFNLAALLVRRAADQLLARDLPQLLLPIRPPLPLRNTL